MLEKIDALDMIISVLQDHEKALDHSINRLEGIREGSSSRSSSEQLLSMAKEILVLCNLKGWDVSIRVHVSKNSYFEADIAKKKRKKTRRHDSPKETDPFEACPVIIT